MCDISVSLGHSSLLMSSLTELLAQSQHTRELITNLCGDDQTQNYVSLLKDIKKNPPTNTASKEGEEETIRLGKCRCPGFELAKAFQQGKLLCKQL